jgi:lysozyme
VLRTINDAGLNLIKSFEGCRLAAYQDVAGIWTIGYASLGDCRASWEMISRPGTRQARLRANLAAL